MPDHRASSSNADVQSPKAPPLPDVTSCYAPQSALQPSTAVQFLTDRQEAALVLFVAGKSVATIAKRLGIHRQTLWRWRFRDPAFAAELRRRRAEVWDHAARHLTALTHPALDVVEEQLRNRNQDRRFSAANAVLSMTNLGRAAGNLASDDAPGGDADWGE